MYTEAGDAAVDEVYSKIIKRHGPPQSEEEVYDLIKKISQEVIKMGKGQSNPKIWWKALRKLETLWCEKICTND
jgi:hypothetical protein